MYLPVLLTLPYAVPCLQLPVKGKTTFKERSAAVGREAALQKQLQEAARDRQVQQLLCLKMQAAAACLQHASKVHEQSASDKYTSECSCSCSSSPAVGALRLGDTCCRLPWSCADQANGIDPV